MVAKFNVIPGCHSCDYSPQAEQLLPVPSTAVALAVFLLICTRRVLPLVARAVALLLAGAALRLSSLDPERGEVLLFDEIVKVASILSAIAGVCDCNSNTRYHNANDIVY